MGAESDDEHILASIRGALARAVDDLAASSARDEALARFVEPRRTLLIRRRAGMVSVGRVWRLGAILLDRSVRVYETGLLTRAVEPKQVSYHSGFAEQRRDWRAAASRAGFDQGETVNFEARPIDLTIDNLRSGAQRLYVSGATVMVRWSSSAPGGSAVELDRYLADRIGLLIDPPKGA